MEKIKTGIEGLDTILSGGYAKGKSTLIKGGPGCGKTILTQCAIKQNLGDDYQIIVVSSDEATSTIEKNLEKYQVDVKACQADGKLKLLDFCPSLSDQVVGDFEMDAILLRVRSSITEKNVIVVIDSLQNLFIWLKPKDPMRALVMLLNWFRENAITLIATVSDQGIYGSNGAIEEYATDCVIHIYQGIQTKLMTRYLRVEKYRNVGHGTNQYPFLINKNGISILPITNAKLREQVSLKRHSTGIEKIDKMLGGGYLDGSSIMISGESGTAKSLLAATMINCAVKENKKVLFISYEESELDYLAHIKSIGIDLDPFIKKQMVYLKTMRSVEKGLEEHLISITDDLDEIKPDLLVIDPVTSLLDLGSMLEVKSVLIRFTSYLKAKNVSTIFVELLKSVNDYNSIIGVSSLVDTWIKLRQVETNGEFNRSIYIVKSRGSATSKQVKEFKLTDKGICIEEPYIGEGGILFGSEKDQKQLIDDQNINLLNKQLKDIDQLLDTLNDPQSDSSKVTPLLKLKFDLVDKRQEIEMKLQSLFEINQLNEKLREKKCQNTN